MTMYSMAAQREAARSGYHAWNQKGPNATANRCGYGDPGIAWAWYTGNETARGGMSLEDAYATLKLGRRHG